MVELAKTRIFLTRHKVNRGGADEVHAHPKIWPEWRLSLKVFNPREI